MLKCKCSKCGTEEVFEDHKSAWMEGWDFIGKGSFCGKCPSAEAAIGITRINQFNTNTLTTKDEV